MHQQINEGLSTGPERENSEVGYSKLFGCGPLCLDSSFDPPTVATACVGVSDAASTRH